MDTSYKYMNYQNDSISEVFNFIYSQKQFLSISIKMISLELNNPLLSFLYPFMIEYKNVDYVRKRNNKAMLNKIKCIFINSALRIYSNDAFLVQAGMYKYAITLKLMFLLLVCY